MNDQSIAEQGNCLDEATFVALIVRHERRVCAFMKTLLPLDAEVDDLMQEVSVLAWQKFRSFRYLGDAPDEQFVSWLCTIAKFQVLNERKKRLRNKEIVPFDDTLIDELAALQLQHSAYFEARRTALAECLQKLSLRDREIIRRRFVLEEPIAAIAELIGRTNVTAYQTAARIRVRLLNCVRLALQRDGYQ